MPPFFNILPLILALTIPSFAAQTFKAVVAPITQSNNLFTITLNHDQKLVLDIESPLSWLHCRRSFPRVSCRDPRCSLAQSSLSSSCTLEIPEIPSKPFSPICPCFTLPYNPITRSCAASELTYTDVSVSPVNGSGPLSMDVFVSCAPRSLLQTLPKDCSGVASLSKGSLSLVSQFSEVVISKKYTICLADHGVAVFGDAQTQMDTSGLLTHTPLLRHPTDNAGYYVDLRGISVNSRRVNLTKEMLSFDSNGEGGVKLSTTTRYTAIRSDIYTRLLLQLERASRGLPRAPAIAPFHLCFNTTGLGSAEVRLQVPQISLQLSGGGSWTISGANSAMPVTSDVTCLAFVDAGMNAKHAMVIGSYQMQHHLVVFDLELMRVGFSPSLLLLNSSCTEFDFTFGTRAQ